MCLRAKRALHFNSKQREQDERCGFANYIYLNILLSRLRFTRFSLSNNLYICTAYCVWNLGWGMLDIARTTSSRMKPSLNGCFKGGCTAHGLTALGTYNLTGICSTTQSDVTCCYSWFKTFLLKQCALFPSANISTRSAPIPPLEGESHIWHSTHIIYIEVLSSAKC